MSDHRSEPDSTAHDVQVTPTAWRQQRRELEDELYSLADYVVLLRQNLEAAAGDDAYRLSFYDRASHLITDVRLFATELWDRERRHRECNERLVDQIGEGVERITFCGRPNGHEGEHLPSVSLSAFAVAVRRTRELARHAHGINHMLEWAAIEADHRQPRTPELIADLSEKLQKCTAETERLVHEAAAAVAVLKTAQHDLTAEARGLAKSQPTHSVRPEAPDL